MEDNCSNFISILTAQVRYDKGLSLLEKILFSEISARCDVNGICWENNQYFANVFLKNEKTISRSIKNLEKKAYIKIAYRKRGSQIVDRAITINTLYDSTLFSSDKSVPRDFEKTLKNKRKLEIASDESEDRTGDRNEDRTSDKSVPRDFEKTLKNKGKLEIASDVEVEEYNIYNKKINNNKNNNIFFCPKKPSSRFIKPSKEEIKKYCDERKNKIDVEKFFDYYESNGWKVGKNAMKDWKAAVRLWEKNQRNEKELKNEYGFKKL